MLPAFVLLFSSCGNRKPVQPGNEEIPYVRVITPEVREVSIPVRATGILSLSDEVKLSFKTGGIIESVNVSEGQKVKKGQLLASLNLAEIRAAHSQARNAFEKAERDFERAGNLFRDSVATLEMKQNASTALEVARSNMEVAGFNLEHSAITAPSDGVILKQLARTNELISAGYPVFIFGSSGKYWKVKTGLADRDIIRISRGDSAEVTFDAYPGRKFPATVENIGSMADPYTGTYETELLLTAGGVKLASGFIASVDIRPATGQALSTVPLSAIIDADGHSGYVFALSEDGTVRRIKVGIEGLHGETAAISALPANTGGIVSEGAAWLRDGMKVKVATGHEDH